MAFYNKRAGIQLAYPYSDKRIEKNFCIPYLVQPKLNGERCRVLTSTDGAVTLLSSEENIITSVPHITKAIQDLMKEIGVLPELDGELYVHGWSLQKIRSAVSRKKALHPEYVDVSLNIFDIVIEADQFKRLSMLYEHIRPHAIHPLRVVETTPCSTIPMIEALLTDYMSEGYEGVIIRDPRAPYIRRRATHMLKWKPRKHDCYLILSVNEAISVEGIPMGTLGSLTLTVDGEQFNCGAGMLSHEQRQQYWDDREYLPNQFALIKYPELTDRGVPSHPVLVEISSVYIGDEDE